MFARRPVRVPTGRNNQSRFILGYPSSICSLNETSVLFDYTVSAYQAYTRYSFTFRANTTAVIITFSLKDDATFWLLDNVSMTHVNTSRELLLNGDFEDVNITHWNYCNPQTSTNGCILGYYGSYIPQSGHQFYFGAPHPNPDYLSQSVRTDIGEEYTLSFWIAHMGGGSNNNFRVTLTA